MRNAHTEQEPSDGTLCARSDSGASPSESRSFRRSSQYGLALILLSLAGFLLLLPACEGGTKKVSGVRAGFLDYGAENGTTTSLPAGEWFNVGCVVIKNLGKSPAIIESATPVVATGQYEATPARVALIRVGEMMTPLPLAGGGWPPPGYERITRNLPTKNVTIPPGREVQLSFGFRSVGRPGTLVKTSGIRVLFHQGGRRYDWLLPTVNKIHTIKKK